MYRLLLVTDRPEVLRVIHNVSDWGQLMFHPPIVMPSPEEGVAYLRQNQVDAVGFSFNHQSPATIAQYLKSEAPTLPIFQTHAHDDTLADELVLIREFLDKLHADYYDASYEIAMTLQWTEQELMHELLRGEVPGWKNLKSRLKLCRSAIIPTAPCFLFDFAIKDGEDFVSERWHYGPQRLEKALARNFFGRCTSDLHYTAALLPGDRLSLLVCQEDNPSPKSQALLEKDVKEDVEESLAEIRDYLGLELNLTRFHALNELYDIFHTEEVSS